MLLPSRALATPLHARICGVTSLSAAGPASLTGKSVRELRAWLRVELGQRDARGRGTRGRGRSGRQARKGNAAKYRIQELEVGTWKPRIKLKELDPCSGPLRGAPRAGLGYVASMSEQGPRPMDDRLVKLVVEIQVG